ncbi:MAG: hypothetical protein GY711_18895 [bacterium]|nr:hypothetical protein [bacterium]
MSTCPSCGVELETPLGCAACGALLELGADATPFEILGLPIGYDVDPTDLRKRLLRFSRLVHPDFYATADEALRSRAESGSAALNSAHEIVADDARRADWLLRALEGPSETDERQMPQEFLMEVLEWNEALEEARESAPGSGARSALTPLEETLNAERASVLAEVARSLSPTPAPGAPALTETRKRLNALRYLDRTLAEMRALRLEQAANR